MKKKIAISIDADVLAFVDQLAQQSRMERSSFINWHFAELMKPAPPPISADIPAPAGKAKRKRAG